MKSNVDLLKSIGIKLGTVIFSIIIFIFFLRNPILSREIVLKCLSTTIVITSILVVLIERFFWKDLLRILAKSKWIWTFFDHYECPILHEEYKCLIKYEWPVGTFREKEAMIKVSQTYTSVTMELITDEIKSRSLISEIVKENDEFVLYYTYRTNPKAQFLDINRGQYGGARIVLNSIVDNNANSKIEGIYWTTSKTKGDIFLY